MAVQRTIAVLVTTLLGLGLGACGLVGDDLLSPGQLPDPCAMISDDVLGRLAPGSTRVPADTLSGDSGYRDCAVDLTGSFAGDLALQIQVGDGWFDKAWRTSQCERIGGKPSDAGPGDTSCVVVKPWQDGEGRFDGYAWIGEDYQVFAVYQLVKPEEFPAGAEQAMRALLAAGIDAIK